MAITHPKSLAHTHVGVWTGLLDQCKTYSRSKWIQALYWKDVDLYNQAERDRYSCCPTPFHYLFPFPDGKFYIWVQYQELKVAYWVKHWTAHRKVQGSSPTCSRDLFLLWVHSALPQKLSRRFTFVSFGGDIKPLVPGNPLKLA